MHDSPRLFRQHVSKRCLSDAERSAEIDGEDALKGVRSTIEGRLDWPEDSCTVDNCVKTTEFFCRSVDRVRHLAWVTDVNRHARYQVEPGHGGAISTLLFSNRGPIPLDAPTIAILCCVLIPASPALMSVLSRWLGIRDVSPTLQARSLRFTQSREFSLPTPQPVGHSRPVENRDRDLDRTDISSTSSTSSVGSIDTSGVRSNHRASCPRSMTLTLSPFFASVPIPPFVAR